MSDEYDDLPWAWLGYALGLVGGLLLAGALVGVGYLILRAAGLL